MQQIDLFIQDILKLAKCLSIYELKNAMTINYSMLSWYKKSPFKILIDLL